MKQLFTTTLVGAALVSAASAQGGGTWTQSVDNTTLQSGSVSCQNSQGITDNSYWRKYDPIECGLTGPYIVKSATFGVEFSVQPATGFYDITVNIRQANPNWPVGGSADPIIVSGTASVADTDISLQTFVTVTFATPPTIAAGTCIAVEIFAPNGMGIPGGFFFPGSNSLGQTAPSYISAADCGVPDPTDLVLLGFPNVNYVLDLDCNPAGPPPIEYICDPANANSSGNSADTSFQGNRDQNAGPYDVILTTVGLPSNQFGYYLASRDPRVPGLPVSNGILCLQGDIARLIGAGQPGVLNSGPGGTYGAILDPNNIPTNPNRAIMPGETWYFQSWYRDVDAQGNSKSNFSNACCIPFF